MLIASVSNGVSSEPSSDCLIDGVVIVIAVIALQNELRSAVIGVLTVCNNLLLLQQILSRC